MQQAGQLAAQSAVQVLQNGKDKIYAACGQQIRGFTRKGKVQLPVQLGVQLPVQLGVQLAWDSKRITSRKAAENSLRKLRQYQGIRRTSNRSWLCSRLCSWLCSWLWSLLCSWLCSWLWSWLWSWLCSWLST